MFTRISGALLAFLSLPAVVFAQSSPAPMVRFETSLGNIDVVLAPESAPATVQNFLNYVRKGAYTKSFVHRSVPGFIWQGGGYRVAGGQFAQIPQDPPVRNEYRISNTRGTIAMAKLGNDPNSATNQWFFNISDANASNLNNQNGGFTVFGRVANAESLAVMDRIAAIQPRSLGEPFDQIPLVNYTGGQPTEANLVMVNAIVEENAPAAPAIAGIVSASAFGGFQAASPGGYIEIYGSNFARTTRGWEAKDFLFNRAPRILDGVSVTVNGQGAYVAFVSPGQVNVQIPSNVPTGREVPVVVTYGGQASAPVMLAVRSAPGLLAPASFKVGGKQYVGALHSANGTFVTNGSIPGLPAAPAVSGETLLFYGVGFGPVNPATIPIAGEIADGQTNIAAPLRFEINGVQAELKYAGLIPGLVGVYQFNVVVPNDLPAGDLPVKVTLGADEVAQQLFLPVAAR